MPPGRPERWRGDLRPPSSRKVSLVPDRLWESLSKLHEHRYECNERPEEPKEHAAVHGIILSASRAAPWIRSGDFLDCCLDVDPTGRGVIQRMRGRSDQARHCDARFGQRGHDIIGACRAELGPKLSGTLRSPARGHDGDLGARAAEPLDEMAHMALLS